MKPENVNKKWAMGVGFDTFCKDANIAKLSYSEQCQLWQQVTGREPDIAKAEPKEPKIKNKGVGK